MLRGKGNKIAVAMVILGLWLALPLTQAQAVPSFARQTGLECNSCHTMFPELTQVGRNFKLNGYTATKHGDKRYEWPPPVSASVQLSFTNLKKSMPQNSGLAGGFEPNFDPKSRANDNVNVPQEISLFYAGRIYGEHLGAFIEGSYDGVENKFSLGHTDVRFTVKPELFGKPLILGLTVNNSPTLSDVLNTTPVWGFPAQSPAVALTPSAGPQIESLGGNVGGIGGYFYWNNLLYAEMAVYRTSRKGVTQFLGAGTVTDPVIQDVAPYWRVFLNHQWGKHSVQVGHFGLVNRNLSPANKPVDPATLDADGNPTGIPNVPNLVDTRGPIDRFTDLGFDAQYQFIGKKHIFTVQTSFIHEDQRLNNADSQQASFGNSAWLDKYKINANYYYRTDNWGSIGGTIAYVTMWGSRNFGAFDPAGEPFGLYGPGAGTGFRTGKPNSDWWIFEVDYIPWWKQFVTKFTLQYTAYSRFNGSRSLYDGNGANADAGTLADTFPFGRRNASHNNSLYLLAWQTF